MQAKLSPKSITYYSPPPSPKLDPISEPFSTAEIKSDNEIDLNQIAPETNLTPLTEAIVKRQFPAMYYLISHNEVDKNLHTFKVDISFTEDGEENEEIYFPVLVIICCKGKEQQFLDVLKFLCQQTKFNINEQTNKYKVFALYCALVHNNLPAAHLLLDFKIKKGLEINSQIFNGVSALHMAAQKGFLDIVERLLAFQEINANIITLKDKSTPLVLAVVSDQENIVKVLLSSHKVDIFLATHKDGSAFMIAKNQASQTLVKVFETHFEEHFLIDFSDESFSQLKKLLDCGSISMPDFSKIRDFPILEQLMQKIPTLQYLQFNKAGILYTEENNEKIVLVRMSDNTIFFDCYDYSFFKEYIFLNHISPLAPQLPISNFWNLLNPHFTQNCYMIQGSVLKDVANLFNIA